LLTFGKIKMLEVSEEEKKKRPTEVFQLLEKFGEG
jgi:hypothetical protein